MRAFIVTGSSTKLCHGATIGIATTVLLSEWSKTSINFLDFTLSLIEGVMETDLFVKPTDSHQYLQSSSCHPFHCQKGIPYSQALRLKPHLFRN